MLNLENLLSIAKEDGWTVNKDDQWITLGKFSPAGQDFSIIVELEDINNDYDFVEYIKDIYDNFDVSYETYLWLDDTGHGQNGAPYDMKDVYEDMKICEENIILLASELESYLDNWTEEEN